MATKDPFRTADKATICPSCKESFSWNCDDGLKGQTCSCGHVFTGHERNPDTRDRRARQKSSSWARK